MLFFYYFNKKEKFYTYSSAEAKLFVCDSSMIVFFLSCDKKIKIYKCKKIKKKNFSQIMSVEKQQPFLMTEI